MSLVFAVACVLLALLLDRVFKEPSRYHPLVGFGNWAQRVEAFLRRRLGESSASTETQRAGAIAWCVAVGAPLLVMIGVLAQLDLLFWGGVGGMWLVEAAASKANDSPFSWPVWLISGIVLYIAIGWQSLLIHARNVAKPLALYEQSGDQVALNAAREHVGRIVSRQTESLSDTEVASAATESVLENGADAIFAAIFWFALLGVPGVILYRLSNTLDAMWGYKNTRYLDFGRCAAKLDDALNYMPARLCALSYALAGHYQSAMSAWKAQGSEWKSPNAGPVMSAGAGALSLKLGGPAKYDGQRQDRPVLGIQDGDLASAASIDQACRLVNRALIIWVVGLLLISLWVA